MCLKGVVLARHAQRLRDPPWEGDDESVVWVRSHASLDEIG
eukprot:COSAG06_NODE_24013_length_675_cov_0.824653_1_plen_40_part_10